jgi:hypothetical protein
LKGNKVAELTLISTHQRPLKPLVEAALANELRLLEAGIQRTERRLREFEARYQLSTDEFTRRFEGDEFEETLEFAEWIGEYRLLERLREKVDTLQGVEFANSEDNIVASPAPILSAVLDEVEMLVQLP